MAKPNAGVRPSVVNTSSGKVLQISSTSTGAANGPTPNGSFSLVATGGSSWLGGANDPVIRQAAQDASFGIGAQLRARAKKEGCWSFGYRAKEEIARVGPVAAKRKRSKSFADKAACELARSRLDPVELHASEECACD